MLKFLEDEEVLNTIAWVFAAAFTVCASVFGVTLFAVGLGRLL